MNCSSTHPGAHNALGMLPAELFQLVAKLLPAEDLGRTEATSHALRAAVQRVVRERAAEWGGFGTGAVERIAGESWAGLSLFIEMRSQVAPDYVALGSDHTLAVSSTGALWAWGYGHYGHLGHGGTFPRIPNQVAPKQVEALAAQRVVHVAAHEWYTLATTSTGALWAWGRGNYGRLGHGDTKGHLMPRRVEALAAERMVRVAAGMQHSLAVTDTGVLWAWGYGGRGQLGHGDQQPEDEPVPRRVEALQIGIV